MSKLHLLPQFWCWTFPNGQTFASAVKHCIPLVWNGRSVCAGPTHVFPSVHTCTLIPCRVTLSSSRQASRLARLFAELHTET